MFGLITKNNQLTVYRYRQFIAPSFEKNDGFNIACHYLITKQTFTKEKDNKAH